MEPFDGETPLQAIARQAAAGDGEFPTSSMTSLERFPYYSAFPFAWYPIVLGDALPAGAVRPVRLLARDLVLWRDDDGVAHVMDAYCPHLGANLGIGGRVENGNLVCPYHWWEWAADGTNANIPYSDKTNNKARLRTYPTIERNGLVMFWFHPDPGQEPLWEIPSLDEYLTDEWVPLEPAEWTVRCPWQELAENGPDYVHLRTVHGAASVPELESLEFDGYHNRLRSKVEFDTPRGPTSGRIDTDGYGPGFSVARFSGIVDTVFFNVTVPIDWETTWSMKLYRVNGPASVGEALVRDLKKQMAEDNVIFDNKVQVPVPALADADGPILQFRRWAAQFYVDGDPVADGRSVVSR
ncbi:MAG: Rieske 2Fe-2S domain-containing protein [Actinomycetota bacterium]